jgi:hypothetical protein
MMPVNKLRCEGAGVPPGDIVDVEMERDEEERTVNRVRTRWLSSGLKPRLIVNAVRGAEAPLFHVIANPVIADSFDFSCG